ncbi:MAG: efflux RND transporter permease subunit [Myxococcales bacterium]|jgi:HAE1 family hydrophobic/amphiphilic exporter-1|nr:efflux RND transporter permease subunit [Myxococcales bacterium]
MSITSISVKRPVTGIMIFLALTILGLFTFSRLKLDQMPDIEFPIIAVITSYVGADPEAIEQLVTKPIEEAMASVENVDKITSQSREHVSLVIVQFNWGTEMNQAEQEVRRNLEIYAYDNLPEDVTQPITFKFDPSMIPVALLAVNMPGTAAEVRKKAKDEIEPYLSRLPGVAAATVSGGDEREIQVRLRPEWLQAYAISPAQISSAIKGANMMIPSGALDQGQQQLGLRTTSEITDPMQLKDVLVSARNGQPIYLRDIADVLDTFQEQESFSRVNHRDAVILQVQKQSDANTVQVVRGLLAEIPKLEQRLPAGSKITVLMESADPILKSINNLGSSAFLAIFITAAVLLAFLRSWRTSSIVLVSIPLSMLATFAVMEQQNLTLNIISMAGLALAVGMLVDNSVVVLENIFSHLEAGKSRVDAAIQGTEEMAMPITASTLTTLVVFVPILFVPGIAGQMFRELSLTICFSLTASLIVALTLVPLMASLMISNKTNWWERLLGKLTFWIDPLSNLYERAIAVCLRHRWLTIFCGVLTLVGAIALVPRLDFDFMARVDQGRVNFKVKMAPGTSVWTANDVFKEMERIIAEEVPEAVNISTSLGSDSSNTFSSIQGQTSSSGTIRLRTVDLKDRTRSIGEIERAVTERFKEIPGIEVQVQQQGGMSSQGDLVLNIFSENLIDITETGLVLKNRLEMLPGVLDATFSSEAGQPEMKIELDREQIRLLGMAPAEVASTVSTYYLGSTASQYRDGNDEYRIFVRAPEEARQDVDKLRALPIVTPYGVVPLDTVAEITSSLGPSAIAHENKRRLGSIAVTKTDDTALGALQQSVEEAVAAESLPEGVSTSIGGSAEDMQESIMGLMYALLVAIVLVYMVMASQFESLLEPFAILLSVPISFAGVIFSLVITQTTVQVTALIGCLLLVGVVVNNGIVLLDVLKRRRLEGMDLVDAAREAARSRLRPILMTTLTTILGMLPMAFEIGDGAAMWAPMGRVVVGGMTLAFFLTLFIVPCVYVAMASVVDRRKSKKQSKQRREGDQEGLLDENKVSATS